MPERTHTRSATRLSSPWSPARSGAGATSMRTMSEAAIDQRESPPLAETPDIYGAYPRLSDDQIAALEAGGARRTVNTGETLVREGERSDYFFVMLSGKVAVTTTDDAGNRHVIRVHGPGRFLGELGDLEGQAAFYTAEVVEPGEVLVVPTERVRALVAHDPVLSDLILRAYLLRRSLLIQEESGFRIIGSCYSPDTARLREFAARNRLPHRWIDLERDKHAERLLQRFGVSPQDAPVVIWGGEVLRNPTNTELARRVGLPVPDTVPDESDVVVVGAGPAGRGGVCRVGRPDHRGHGAHRNRRAGRDVIENRELPRIPRRNLRSRPCRTGRSAGRQVRSADHRLRGDHPAGIRQRPAPGNARGRWVGGGQGCGAGHGSQVSKARCPGNRIVRGQRRVLRRHLSRSVDVRHGARRHRRGWELRGAGGDLPRRAGFPGVRGDPRRRPEQNHVPVSRRPDRPASPRDRPVVHRDPGGARKRCTQRGGDRGQTNRRAGLDPGPRPVR